MRSDSAIGRIGHETGISLLETVVVSVLGALMGGVILSMVFATFRAVGTVSAQTTLQIQLRQTLDQLTRDIQQARFAIPDGLSVCSGAFRVDIVGGQIPTDTDGDGIIDTVVDQGGATWVLGVPPRIAGVVTVGANPPDWIVYTYDSTNDSTNGQLRRRLGCPNPLSERTAAEVERLIGRDIEAIVFAPPPNTTVNRYREAVNVTLIGRRVAHGITYRQTMTARAVYRQPR